VAVAVRRQYWRDSLGKLTGLFFFGYALARATCEFFREPEVDLGPLGFVTWGQVLCVPMAAFGLYLMLRRQPRQHQPEAAGQ